MLAELHRNETSIDALSSTRTEKQLQGVAKKDELMHKEEMVKADKKQHRRLSVEQQLLEKEIRCVRTTKTQKSLFIDSLLQLIITRVNDDL